MDAHPLPGHAEPPPGPLAPLEVLEPGSRAGATEPAAARCLPAAATRSG
jgi:hypothetical protein